MLELLDRYRHKIKTAEELRAVNLAAFEVVDYVVIDRNAKPLENIRLIEPDCTFADISKIRSRLGWRPTVSFDDGVHRMLTDIERWRDAPLWDPDRIAEATKTWFRYLGKQSA